MGQKTHPLGFRLGVTQHHRSQWFSKPSCYPQLVVEDHYLRQTLFDTYVKAGITDIEIQRKFAESTQLKIIVKAYNPKVIVGRNKKGLKLLRKNLKEKLNKYRIKNNLNLPIGRELISDGKTMKIDLKVIQFKNPASQAAFVAKFLAVKIENRVRFRFALKQAIEKVSGVKGIKIQISGRLNGAEIARSEWVRKGRVPLQTLRADIDYSHQTAKTTYGLIGIKVWIFKGEFSTLC